MKLDAILLPYPVGTNRLWRTVRGRVIPSADDKQVTQIRAALGEPIPEGGLSFTITVVD